jgi:UDP-N-acetylmuramyl pentapeptide phosphotransferase/UDP-N-acetylglucosamine-1-phosphate transferase
MQGEYLLYLILFLGFELLYLKIADKFNIIDKPNQRSSHTVPIIRGGGIVFLFSVLVWEIQTGFEYPWLLASILLSGIVSFVDDLKGLPSKLRFVAHLGSVGLLLYQTHLFQLTWWVLPLFILLIGIKNAYNFMDGINGITGFYSLGIFIPFWMIETDIVLKQYCLLVIISILVFLFFNARKKAKCFAGDIGSISMAIMVLFIVLSKIIETGRFELISVLFVYGIDSIFTIVQRFLNNENIFEAHRKHLYQNLANEYKIDHLWVSAGYALVQLLFNFWLLQTEPSLTQVVLVVVVFGLGYIGLKKYLLNKLALIKA